MKVAPRYWVINRYPGKHGLSSSVAEFISHEAATKGAARAVLTLIKLTGSCDEEFIVFVGSKSALDRFVKLGISTPR